MPTYDYRCDHCGHEFSKIQSFKEGALEACPNCGERPTRLVSVPSIVFKGSGWYKTDSRRTPASEKSSGGETKASEPAKDAPKDTATDSATKDKPAGSA